MRRNWSVIRSILEAVENGTLERLISSNEYLNIPELESADDFLGHLELLIEAGIVRHGEVIKGKDGKFAFWDLRGTSLTMQGYDLLDSLRDKTVWNAVTLRAKKAGIAISWEFLKAVIPLVLKQIAERT